MPNCNVPFHCVVCKRIIGYSDGPLQHDYDDGGQRGDEPFTWELECVDCYNGIEKRKE